MTNETHPLSTDVFNGEAVDSVWECGGYQFSRSPDYEHRIQDLPRLGGFKNLESFPANLGTHVATFNAVPIHPEAERSSRWFYDGTSLDDIIALWSFAGGVPVFVEPLKRPPTADERSYVIAHPNEIVNAVKTAYKGCRQRPVTRQAWSSLLTYLEIAHVRPIQVKSALVTSVLECLAPIGMPSPAGSPEFARYEPIVEHLASLPLLESRKLQRSSIEALVVALYRVRNKFLHSGIHPYQEDIEIGPATLTTGRVVAGSRMLAKLAVANALKFPPTRAAAELGRSVQTLLTDGSFVPRAITELLRLMETTEE